MSEDTGREMIYIAKQNVSKSCFLTGEHRRTFLPVAIKLYDSSHRWYLCQRFVAFLCLAADLGLVVWLAAVGGAEGEDDGHDDHDQHSTGDQNDYQGFTA